MFAAMSREVVKVLSCCSVLDSLLVAAKHFSTVRAVLLKPVQQKATQQRPCEAESLENTNQHSRRENRIVFAQTPLYTGEDAYNFVKRASRHKIALLQVGRIAQSPGTFDSAGSGQFKSVA